MKSILVQMNCKYCMYQSHKQSETLILPEFEPYLKEQIMKNTFFNTTCPQCGASMEYLHTCIYTDKKHGFILFIKPKKERKEADLLLYQDVKCHKRYISNTRDIPEKIKILEEGFDDRVIEILKAKIYILKNKQHKTVKSIRYHDMDKASQTIWFDIETMEGQETLAVTFASYEQIRHHIPIDLSSFVEINEEWAFEYLKKM